MWWNQQWKLVPLNLSLNLYCLNIWTNPFCNNRNQWLIKNLLRKKKSMYFKLPLHRKYTGHFSEHLEYFPPTNTFILHICWAPCHLLHQPFSFCQFLLSDEDKDSTAPVFGFSFLTFLFFHFVNIDFSGELDWKKEWFVFTTEVKECLPESKFLKHIILYFIDIKRENNAAIIDITEGFSGKKISGI